MDACPLPSAPSQSESNAILAILSMKRIAIVGLSEDPSRPSHGVAQYLISRGKQVIPVNPNVKKVLNQPAVPALDAVPEDLEAVCVFRRPEFCPEIAREAIAAGAKGIWLQSGIRSEEARSIAQDAGLWFVQDRCMMVELMRLTRT